MFCYHYYNLSKPSQGYSFKLPVGEMDIDVMQEKWAIYHNNTCKALWSPTYTLHCISCTPLYGLFSVFLTVKCQRKETR